MSNSEPSGNYKGTVPAGQPLQNDMVVKQVPVHGINNATADTPTIPPGKPQAVTGPGGPGISIPTAGKSGK